MNNLVSLVLCKRKRDDDEDELNSENKFVNDK